ncbi:MAG: hypothetical protein AABY44_02655 [Nitrospirota bacterium]
MLRDFKPAVDRKALIFLAGIVWSIAGIILCSYAVSWLSLSGKGLSFGLAGLLISLIVYHFGFSDIVKKNIDRISLMGEKVCIFAFQPWKSYIVVVSMMGMGILLRQLPIPKHYLSIIYIGMGLAMIFSSIQYYRVFLKVSVEGG